MADELQELILADAAGWRTWLAEHHESSPGVWLLLAKKGTVVPTSLSYQQALEEALCHGWIDGQLRRQDQTTYRQRFTPDGPVAASLDPKIGRPVRGCDMIAGLLLAAGAGRRYGMPKALVDGGAWLRRAVATLTDGGCDSVLVVVGAQADQVVPLVPVTASTVLAEDWAQGMGASLRTGLAELLRSAPPQVQAALVHLVDLPDVDAAVVRRLVALAGPAVVARAGFETQPGHPVLLGRQHWADIVASAQGDRGARDWLAQRHDLIVVDCSDLASGIDVDTPGSSPQP
jgi:CTP:molybdopterin cytidylyltransferase MocA